jgi:hypothetical protein
MGKGSRRYHNLIGRRFTRLTVIAFAGTVPDGPALWVCLCDCGRQKVVRAHALKNGNTKSCGCYNIEFHTGHGKWGSGAYNSWRDMLQRCNNPNDVNFKRYGGRGIRVCERWLKFENFYADMGPRPDGHVISRINHDGNYELLNCKWITKSANTAESNQRRPASHTQGPTTVTQ